MSRAAFASALFAQSPAGVSPPSNAVNITLVVIGGLVAVGVLLVLIVRLASSSHPVFWTLSAAWSVGLVVVGVALVGFVQVSQNGVNSWLGYPYIWWERGAIIWPTVVFGGLGTVSVVRMWLRSIDAAVPPGTPAHVSAAVPKPDAPPPDTPPKPDLGPWLTLGEASGVVASGLLCLVSPWVFIHALGYVLTKDETAMAVLLSLFLFALGIVCVMLSRATRRSDLAPGTTPYDHHVRARARLGLPPALTRAEFNAQLDEQLRANVLAAEAEARPPTPPAAVVACPTCGAAIPPGSPQNLCPRCLLRRAMPSPSMTRGRPTRAVEPPSAAELAALLPHLEVLELIGVGGMGAVYKARQPNLDRLVALKIVQSPTGEADPEFAARFAREARAMAKLDHPNIVAIHESGEAGGVPYLLMEYVDGITLREAMANKVLTLAEALAVVPQVCDALDYAHRAGVVHRDIKPENILIDQTGRVRIADFGLAKLADATGTSLTHSRQMMGTPHYMAPEQWERPNEVDHRADIYALGVILYELLTGELPLGRFDLPSQKGRGDARVDAIILLALAKEPNQRYQRAGDVKTALSGIDLSLWKAP